jgi:hypothetical protein
MKNRIATCFATLIVAVSFGFGQQSDFEIKERFKTMYDALKQDIDSARTREQMALIPNRVKGLETEFAEHTKLLNGAFYPKTLETMIGELNNQYTVAQEKNTVIQNQTDKIMLLEGQLATMSAEIEKLNAERQDLLAKLRSATNSLAQQRELVKRLTANLQAKDRLVNAMVDSIFLPFGKNMDALTEVQQDAIGKKLEGANIISRIADIANDNVRFLQSTTLEAKDYSTLVTQYSQFKSRWSGLRDRVTAAVLATNAVAARKSKGAQLRQTNPAEQVDAALEEWHSKLDASFWASLMEEFKSRNVLVQPFSDAKSFSASIRSFVDASLKEESDPKTFVDEIWIQRIDKDWRPALESESMLGKLEYASLDKVVSQLHKEKFNWSILWWALNVLAVVAVGWYFLTRKPKAVTQTEPATKPNV